MANRRFTSQFSYSFERQHVELMSKFSVSSVGAYASKVTQGLTLTAVAWGTSGNSITIAFTGGATAGSEVVSVVGNAISVQIESGVSSVTQVRTAMQAESTCTALVTTTGTSAATVATATALPLLAGAFAVFAQVGAENAMSLSEVLPGQFQIAMAQSSPSLIGIDIAIQKAIALDLQPQIKSSDVLSAKLIEFRLMTTATPVSLLAGDALFIKLDLRNSANPA